MSDELSLEAFAVLRTLLRRRGQPLSGEEMLERIFATTGEVPLDGDRLCAAVRELEQRGFVEATRAEPIPRGYDFSHVTLTADGEGFTLG